MSNTPPTSLRVAVASTTHHDSLESAVLRGGGAIGPPSEADALIWDSGPAGDLASLLADAPHISWVQLPSAGIERYTDLIHDGREWTCAKGIYARPVAEHALALALAGLHRLPHFARATHWQEVEYHDLSNGAVTILGGGGIARALIDLLVPFHVDITVVRRHPIEMQGVRRVASTDDLLVAIENADVVVLALALTPETTGIIGLEQLLAMKSTAWLVNVGRGKLVKTDDLATALRDGWIGGAALDVTDPEPLPDRHPLWELDNCLITPHCANPRNIAYEQYAALVCDNVRRRIAREPLRGTVDPELGY
jgi:phosphoglycerate dehydrogenase-like enzyme